MRGQRRTKIVATLGPASSTPAAILGLVRAGIDVARLNLSHGSHSEHARRLTHLRVAARAADRTVGVLLDLQGPRMRLGTFAGGGVQLKVGSRFTLSRRPLSGSAAGAFCTYARLASDVHPGDRILVDDGRIQLRVLEVGRAGVTTRVVVGGRVSDHKGINLPGVRVSAAALTAKDEADLDWGIAQQVDYVALSFVRRAADVRRLRAALRRRGAGSVGVIAKLEKPEALDDLEAILEASDGVMVARGDLAVESSPEAVPLAQKRVVEAANSHRKLCIIATQMLESMVDSPTPTRAEASDVANAILDGTDALMLSAETAVGRFPSRAVRMMDRIAREVEAKGLVYDAPAESRPLPSFAHALARAAHALVRGPDDLDVIALYTPHGTVARLLSKDRPPLPVYAFTDDPAVARSLSLVWGVTPLLWERPADTETGVEMMKTELLRRGWLRRGQAVAVLTRLPLREAGETNVLQLTRVDARAAGE